MRKSLLKLLGVVAALVWSAHVSAAGLGGINVISALGQVLNAEINLVTVSKEEKSSLVARLASPEAYKAVGLEYPSGINLNFKIERRADGDLYLKLSSAQPVNDPYVSLLVELTWSSGRLLREYTFLLDPPGYVPELPKPASAQVVAPIVQVVPAVQTAPLEAAAKPDVQAAPAPAAPAKKPGQVAKKPAKPAAPSHAEAKPSPGTARGKPAVDSVTVKRGDTLNSISARNKPAEVSLERMLVALYRANTEQFDGNNMNRIRVGKILRLPNQDELAKVTQPEAVMEIRAQADDWNAYRQKLAAAVPAGSKQQPAKQVVTGKITSSASGKTPLAKEPSKEVLKLSKGATPGDKAGAGANGKPMTAQEKKNAEQEAAITKAKAEKEEQGRAALLEKNIKDAQRLAELKTAAEVLAKSSTQAASAPAAAEQQQLSVVERILSGDPFVLVGLVVAVLGLGGLIAMLSSNRKVPVSRQSMVSAPISAPSISPQAGSAVAGKAADSAEAARQMENPDPLSEADLLLNFGREEQAEEVLKQALQDKPDDHPLQLKLLGIYAGRKDMNAFADIARRLKDSGDEEAWQQAAAMGRKLEPYNPLYSDGGIEHADSATVQIAAAGAAAVAVAQQEPPDAQVSTNPSPPEVHAEPGQVVDVGMDFKLDFPVEKPAPAVPAAEDFLAGISLNLDDAAAPSVASSANKDERWHEVATKLDLAKAYREMGDVAGVREILAEVMKEGDAAQREAAQALLDQLG